MAGAEAAKAAVNGATGPCLAWSLGPAGVPASAADVTAQAMTEAIEAAKTSGSDPFAAAMNVITNAASPPALAAGAAYEGASGSSLPPALSAAGVPTEALESTAEAVAAAVSAAGGSRSAAVDAATKIIEGAAAPTYARANSPEDAVSPSQAALDVLGASCNFWHTIPWIVWDTLGKLQGNATDSSDAEGLEGLVAMGPPPEAGGSMFHTLPYRRGGNRVHGLPSLPTDAPRTPSSTNNGVGNNTQSSTPYGINNGTHNDTHNDTQHSRPPLKPAPPGTGGYLYDGKETTPSPRG